MAEKRTDPVDGKQYTLDELLGHYKDDYKRKEIQKYFETECTAVTAKGKKAKADAKDAPKEKDEPKAKAKAKAKVKAKEEPKALVQAEPKAKARAKGKAKDAPKEKAEPGAKAKAKGKAKAKAKDTPKLVEIVFGPRILQPRARRPAPAESVIERVTGCKIVPGIELEDASYAAPLCKALKEGGIDVVKISFRSSGGADAIREACKNKGICVGAGSVLTPQQVNQAVESGADFVASPVFDPAIAKRCSQKKVLYIPGVVTPTEVMMVTSKFKLKVLNFCPASNFGGAGTLKSYSAVFQDVKFMPTGGVTEANIGEFVGLPNVVAASGSWMASDAAIKKAAESGDWSGIAAGAHAASEAAKAGAGKK